MIYIKPLYRCDYCDFVGTEREVLKHENSCIYKIRSCEKCANVMVRYDINTNMAYYCCKCGKYIKIKDGFNKYCDKFEKAKFPLYTRYYEQLENNQYIKNQRRR